MNLRRYRNHVVLSVASQIRNRLEMGSIDWIELALALSNLKFRDDAGRYWFLDARTARWYRFDQTEWRAVPTSPTILEGDASLVTGRATLPRTPESEAEVDEGWTEGSSTRALEEATQLIRSAYARGDLSSWDADRLLARHYVVDREGRFWAVGVQSGRWYRFAQDAWERAAAPPEDDSLLRLEMGGDCEVCGATLRGEDVCPSCNTEVAPTWPELSDDAYAGILDFLLMGKTPPETATEPWNPPAGFPEGIGGEPDAPRPELGRPCTACGAINAPARSLCRRCGLSLEPVDCPDCGARVGSGKKFCTQCGTALSQGAHHG